MTKRKNKQKHQKDVTTADTSDEELNNSKYQGKPCPHVARGVNFSRVKRTFKDNITACSSCSSSSHNDKIPDVCICLQCGHRGCNFESTNGHAFQHFKTIHSDCHSLILNVTAPISVWCYDCKIDVHLQSSSNLRQCVEFIMKLNLSIKHKSAENNQTKQSLIETVIKDENNAKKSVLKESMKSLNLNNKTMPSQINQIKGLRNLGNTCFFNSVMQNLSQTPILLQELEHSTDPKYLYEIPHFVINDNEVSESEECLKLSLTRHSSLINTLHNFIKQMTAPSSSKFNDVINPTGIFDEISKKSPRFRHFQQEDSHELLRQLLDGVKQDEIKRQQLAILKHFDLYGVPAKDVPEDFKKVMKAYSPYSNHTIVEKIFGGVLISTVLCEECKKASQVFEPFMDISLPLFEEKPLRNGKNQESNEEGYVLKNSKKDYNKPSKYQERKSKALAKKERKRNRVLYKGKESPNAENNGTEDKKTNEEVTEKRFVLVNNPDDKYSVKNWSDEDDEGRLKENDVRKELLDSECLQRKDRCQASLLDSEVDQDCSVLFNEEISRINYALETANEVDDSEMMEFGRTTVSYNGNESKESNPELNDRIPPCDPNGCLAKDIQDAAVISENTSNENYMQYISEKMTELDINSQKLSSVERDTSLDNNCLNSSSSSDRDDSPTPFVHCYNSHEDLSCIQGKDGEDTFKLENDSNTNEWIKKSLSSLVERNHSSPLECSIDSCLVHFTKLEMLAGSNKFRCENCTRAKCKKTGNDKEVVYTNASKQLLVFSPPSVLTLHLKRFQQHGMTLRKVNKFVEFPLKLDLAPYCSYASLILPHMSSVKHKVLYSLYGVVEHTGRLNSGHYTAYVKANKRTLDRKFLNQLPLQFDFEKLLQKFEKDLPECHEEEEDPVLAKARWYYVSDSHVREASETQVLKCQAYLLFYERIK